MLSTIWFSVLFEERRWHGNYIFIAICSIQNNNDNGICQWCGYVCLLKQNSLHPIDDVSSYTPAYYKFILLHKSGIIRNENHSDIQWNIQNSFRISYVPSCVCMGFQYLQHPFHRWPICILIYVCTMYLHPFNSVQFNSWLPFTLSLCLIFNHHYTWKYITKATIEFKQRTEYSTFNSKMAYSQFAIRTWLFHFGLCSHFFLLWNIIIRFLSLFVRCSWSRNRISSPNVANKWINNKIHQKPCPMSPLPIRILMSCVWFNINLCINSISNEFEGEILRRVCSPCELHKLDHISNGFSVNILHTR